jgi:hypothetical protein
MFYKYRSGYKNKVKFFLGSEEVICTDLRVLYLRHTSGLFRFRISLYRDNKLEKMWGCLDSRSACPDAPL